jgi:hypothetical protein
MIRSTPSRRFELSGLVVAVALSALIIAIDWRAVLSAYDGGISSSAATFTLHGLLPYRDYWLLYGPLSGFLLAIPTAILGPSVELTRALGFAMICLEAAAAYGVARVWAARGPAIALAVSAVVMVPALTSLDTSAWPIAMLLALAALYLQIGTRRSGLAVGLLLGLAFLSRLDVGVYALAGALVVRDRRAVALGFAVIALPAIVFAVATTGVDPLIEQLIWFPLIGTRQFRALPGPEALLGQPLAALLEIPLLILPRMAIALAVARVVWLRVRRQPEATELGLVGLIVFATLCQLQTLGRADAEHFSQAVTPAILLLAIWFRDARPNLARFAALAGITATCLVVGLVGHGLHTAGAGYARTVIAASDWVHAATTRDERIFVGLTSHRFTVNDPLIVYYLADRTPAVRDDLFNPGVTNTDWGQTRMVADLQRTLPPYLVLDRPAADYRESSNDSRFPGSTLLDTYLAANYHVVCDMGAFVIQGRNDLDRPAPPCPAPEP